MAEGWNIGSVSVKRVRLLAGEGEQWWVVRHGGDPAAAILALCAEQPADGDRLVATGPLAPAFLELPYLPESLCVETALRHLRIEPDLVLSLGGESFVVYCLAGGTVRASLSTNRCAAGSGEFLVQQFGRMNLGLEEGIEAAYSGHRVPMASRCSVHCKSDATHKLNKGECRSEDIAASLIADLAGRIADLADSATWKRDHIVVAGGLTRNAPLVQELERLLPDSHVEAPPQSVYLEALGAALAARETEAAGFPGGSEAGEGDASPAWLRRVPPARFEARRALAGFAGLVTRDPDPGFARATDECELILGVDAGSTTTKAVLYDRLSRRPVAGCYLRTHGNPVTATGSCLEELRLQLGDRAHRIIQVAVTGSGRDIVGVYLDNCLTFNEILAHARAARAVAPDIDTLFELGGQDAKFVALQEGVPVDYAMNDGCSAGTGSFLEEAAASDMQVPIEEIGPRALASDNPIAFGERCAAFINSEVRTALQEGVPRHDVLGGLVYAIADNYVTRVVGARHIGQTILLQGGVALNPALAPALAALTGVDVVVPPQPELMGCVGAAQMAADLLDDGRVELLERRLSDFGRMEMQHVGAFTCKTCENHCEVSRIRLGDHTYPFGGLCSKWEMQRRPKALRHEEGRDLVALRQQLMFEDFAPSPPAAPRGRIGLPRALTTYALYPFYAKLLTDLGYEVVLSEAGQGRRRTHAPFCYPGELLHAAVDDLLARGVDRVFVPYVREMSIPDGHEHGYVCPVTADMPGVIKGFFTEAADRILSPQIGFSSHLRGITEAEILRMAADLGVEEGQTRTALAAAYDYQERFERAYRERVEQALAEVEGPVVVLAGRPYAALAPEVNLAVPRKIASRGFTVVPGDALPFEPQANDRNIWHFTQRLASAAEWARAADDRYICVLSCFSCGPDAIFHHRLREELAGRPFCFLEIDSHTAHAGIETRVGAFLDIIEERRQHGSTDDIGRPSAPAWRPAQVEQRGNEMWVVDSQGERVGFDDPRVLHVFIPDSNDITTELIASLYGSLGWRTVATDNTNHEILQLARRVCSGRECLPFLSMTGKMVAHLENQPEGEISVFHLLDQEGPCQNGNWHDAAPVIFKRLGRPDAVAAWPNLKNNYLGGGEKVALAFAGACIVGDLVSEARSSLRCLAEDPASALAVLEEIERDLMAAGRKGTLATERALRRAAPRLASIPLRSSPRDAPKVLLLSGINRIFVDRPIRAFFEARGILAKTNDVSEFVSFLERESVSRLAFAEGRVRAVEQDRPDVIARQLIHSHDRRLARRAARARTHLFAIQLLERRWRRAFAPSNLLFAPHVPFGDVVAAGDELVSINGWTEACPTSGRCALALQSGEFDGLVNVGAFSCCPANIATAVIHNLAVKSDIPYAVVDADGDKITAGQLRQLETVAARCLAGRGEALAAATMPEPAPLA